MNLDNLKPAWKQYRLFSSMESLDQNEILFIIEQADRQNIGLLQRLVTNTMIFVILTLCCQGG